MPTRGQIKKLTRRARDLVRQNQQPLTPQHIVLAILALLSASVQETEGKNYWAYVPDLPTDTLNQ